MAVFGHTLASIMLSIRVQLFVQLLAAGCSRVSCSNSQTAQPLCWSLNVHAAVRVNTRQSSLHNVNNNGLRAGALSPWTVCLLACRAVAASHQIRQTARRPLTTGNSVFVQAQTALGRWRRQQPRHSGCSGDAGGRGGRAGAHACDLAHAFAAAACLQERKPVPQRWRWRACPPARVLSGSRFTCPRLLS